MVMLNPLIDLGLDSLEPAKNSLRPDPLSLLNEGSFGPTSQASRLSTPLLLGTACTLYLIAAPETAQAASATLAWDRAASHTNLNAFILKWGTNSGSYTFQQVVATNMTMYTVNGLNPGTTYYFVVTARNVANLESDPSNQLRYSVPVTADRPLPQSNLRILP